MRAGRILIEPVEIGKEPHPVTLGSPAGSIVGVSTREGGSIVLETLTIETRGQSRSPVAKRRHREIDRGRAAGERANAPRQIAAARRRRLVDDVDGADK